jgi:predicted transglutaminase-like cysteine proteinase
MMELYDMQIRLEPIDWLDDYKIEKTRYMVEQGIQRTLSFYVAHSTRRTGHVRMAADVSRGVR